VNQWVSLVKDTSLAYIVGVPEFTFLANQVNSRLMIYPAQIFAFVGIVYLVLCSALQWIASCVLLRERRAHATGVDREKETEAETGTVRGKKRGVAVP
jgi:polar amino acid transport system permease protein